VRVDYQVTSEMDLPSADEYKRVLDHYDQSERVGWEEFSGQLSMPGADVGGVGGASEATMIAECCRGVGDGR
jgi:hypothetical protein